MNIRRGLLLLAATATLMISSTTAAFADESDNGPSDEAADTGEHSDSGLKGVVTNSGGTVTFNCPSFDLTENWTQRTTTYTAVDAAGVPTRTWSHTQLRATIAKSPQGTVYTDRGNWVTSWRADTDITTMAGVFEDIRMHGQPIISDYGRIVINGDGVVVSITGHHPANAYAWCLALK